MEDLREKIEESADDSWLSTVASSIPGYAGYLSRERRRDADKLLRDHLVSLLGKPRATLVKAREALTAKLSLDRLDDVERAVKRLETVLDKVRFADRGYSGIFDAVKVNEATLDKVYEFDAALVNEVGALETAAGGVLAAAEQGGDPGQALSALDSAVEQFQSRLDERSNLLNGLA